RGTLVLGIEARHPLDAPEAPERLSAERGPVRGVRRRELAPVDELPRDVEVCVRLLIRRPVVDAEEALREPEGRERDADALVLREAIVDLRDAVVALEPVELV